MPVLFIHGGGDNAYAFDSELVQRLRAALPHVPIAFPRVEGLEKIEWHETFQQLSQTLAATTPDTIVVAHSIGGAAVLKVLSTIDRLAIRNLVVLAAPYKADDSHWGNDDFTFPSDFAERLKPLLITMYHSRDDEVIPVEDALVYAKKLPCATVRILDGYGHQFVKTLDFLADDVNARLRAAAKTAWRV
ncbi:MAG: alpha/beta fold hydrolase [Candidatus Eremiobacteraeota bacterium]|nr:alpha/beta fold hydrolase [Candidatus Eremiobacteraeota bacterium]